MADLNVVINDVVCGDDYDVIRNITNVPVGQFVSEAWLTIRENHWDSDAAITKHITVTISGDGIIEDTGATDTLARVRFALRADETVLLHEFYDYSYDIQLKTDAGKIYTPESGILTPFASVTSEV